MGISNVSHILVDMAKVVLPQSNKHRAGISWVAPSFLFQIKKKRYIGLGPWTVSGRCFGFLAGVAFSFSRVRFIFAKGLSESSLILFFYFLQAFYALTCLHVSTFPSPQNASVLDR